jgi:hypothetical protein
MVCPLIVRVNKLRHSDKHMDDPGAETARPPTSGRAGRRVGKGQKKL